MLAAARTLVQDAYFTERDQWKLSQIQKPARPIGAENCQLPAHIANGMVRNNFLLPIKIHAKKIFHETHPITPPFSKHRARF